MSKKLEALSCLMFRTSAGNHSYHVCNKPETVITQIEEAKTAGETRKFLGERGETFVVDPADFLGGYIVQDLVAARKIDEEELAARKEEAENGSTENTWFIIKDDVEKSLVQQAKFLTRLQSELQPDAGKAEDPEDFWKAFKEWVDLYATEAAPEHTAIVRQFFNRCFSEMHEGQSWEQVYGEDQTPTAQ